MAEAVPMQAVNATASTTTEVADQSTQQPEAKAQPKAKSAKKAPPKFANRVEETLWRVNEPTEDEVSDVKATEEMLDKATQAANAPTEEPKEQTPAQKAKFKVGEQEYELDPEQQARFIQKGILYEKENAKRFATLANREKALTQKEQEAHVKIQEAQAFMEKLRKDGLGAVVEMLGEDEARKQLEGWLRPRIEREMLPEEQQKLIALEERAARAEQELKKREEQAQEVEIQKQAKELSAHYEKIIIDALNMGGVPRTEFTAAEMADWMLKGASRNIDYTPEQLVNLVKEGNILRVNALTEPLVAQINEAVKTGDTASVIKSGDMLAEIFGEKVVWAFGKYHLAKLKSTQPQGAKVLEGPKLTQPKEPSKRMTEDDYAAERRRRAAAIDRGEEVPEWA